MPSKTVNATSAYFNKNWQRYQIMVSSNTLYNREMLSALQQFLSANFGDKAFSSVDVGCGDASTVVQILSKTAISKYIGIDEAEDVLKMAANTLAHLDCKKEFIADNMINAIPRLSEPVDIIFTSYTVHFLALKDKIDFIANCKAQLKSHGFLIMIDGIRQGNQTRDEWLDALQARMKATIPAITAAELANRMEYPRVDDFPESIKTFEKVAQQQNWENFQIIVDKEIFAFMLFSK